MCDLSTSDISPDLTSDLTDLLSSATVPSQPNGLRVVNEDATTAELAWDRPSHSGESIINYVVYYNDSYEAVSGV